MDNIIKKLATIHDAQIKAGSPVLRRRPTLQEQRYMKIYRSLDEKKQLAERLATWPSNKPFDGLVENAGDLIVVFSPSGYIYIFGSGQVYYTWFGQDQD